MWYVKEWMSSPVHVLRPRDSVTHARELLERHRINQLPVVLRDRLVGIITDRDVRDAFPSVFESSRPGRRRFDSPEATPVELVMTQNVQTIAPGATMGEAAGIMRRERIGALPVLKGNRLVGIVARTDVLDAFIALEKCPGQATDVRPPSQSSDEIEDSA